MVPSYHYNEVSQGIKLNLVPGIVENETTTRNRIYMTSVDQTGCCLDYRACTRSRPSSVIWALLRSVFTGR